MASAAHATGSSGLTAIANIQWTSRCKSGNIHVRRTVWR
jgi:hypothetical protein